ncbi:MAG: hypothetical protein IT260_02940 [Saprospiraceae bacterium]|nr:hypothetical protein [Saprospiraceae bacterium]
MDTAGQYGVVAGMDALGKKKCRRQEQLTEQDKHGQYACQPEKGEQVNKTVSGIPHLIKTGCPEHAIAKPEDENSKEQQEDEQGTIARHHHPYPVSPGAGILKLQDI